MSMLSILRIIVYQNRIVVQDENRYIFNDNIKNIIITGEDAILKIFGNNLEIKNYLIGPKIMAKSVKIKINGLTRSINKLTADYDFTYTLGEGQKPTSKFCPTFKIEGNYYVEIHIEDINASILKLIEINSTKVDNQIIGKNNRDVTKFSKPLSDNLEIENHTSKWCNLM
uniref:PKD domain-containing protein n=1 Tax=Meloidogyne hapla TaxID=6305 RepID=A0A1I8BBI7_MELHA